MFEKLIDILKIFLEKYLYRAFLSLVLSLLATPYMCDIFIFRDYSTTELKIILFLLLFLLFSGIFYIYEYIKKKIEKWILEKEEEDKYIDYYLKLIINLKPNDKEILSKFLENNNNPLTIRESKYYGKLVDIQGYNIYFADDTKNWIIILKRYTKPLTCDEDMSTEEKMQYMFGEKCVDIQLNSTFYYILLKLYKKYGKSCLEWK